ncbi:MAG: bifunctional glutamate N-acetyltransferase/amino-acid acetyltransferase ArgJ [Gammaproteobacteria bacterium]|nr:bifunctional glutamate N-acetyltransferase/amino-acid acetyltransferase ArgJ [Gammaproteobacteria bacterium]
MPVGLSAPTDIRPVPGVRLAATAAGIRYRGRDDLALLELAPGGSCAAVFTRNAFRAAPVTVAAEHLAAGAPRYLLINAGNANAGTGARGLADARACCAALAAEADCIPQQVLPFSTGVIGEPLPVERLAGALGELLKGLTEQGWLAAARAIMTTDTLPKVVSRRCQVDGRAVTVTGMAKGSGMIRPDMATMLAFVATDAAVEKTLLDACLRAAVERSFNRITVDGDTSTNDACVLAASGAAGNEPLAFPEDPGFAELQQAVDGVCLELAQAVVRDGEGATRFVTLDIRGGATGGECLAVAYTIAHSPLVKTAWFAGDPNWGRILAAVGRAGLTALDLAGVSIHLDDVCIVEAGGRAAAYTEAAGAAVFARPEFTVRVELGRGDAGAVVWTTDLSYDYVKINAEYRS